ncbi:MAG TPA: DUF885 domain-containing protein [Cyclobacteriaceae bacterium]|nr:DUF885 domain-containing protein [Cyclobacteriaceae bacterium]
MKISAIAVVAFVVCSCSHFQKDDNVEQERAAQAQLKSFVSGLTLSRGRGRGIASDSMSMSSFDMALQKTKDQLATLRKIDTAMLKGDDKIDWKFAESILVGREIDQEKVQPWRKDPRLYMTFISISIMLNSPDDVEKKVGEVEKRLNMVPIQLSNGMKQLDIYVPRFAELGVFMAENGFVLFEKEIPEFIEKSGAPAARLKAPAEAASEALKKYLAFLKKNLPTKTPGTFSMGAQAYGEMLKGQYLLPFDADSLYALGWQQFNATVAELEAMAKKMDPSKSWQQLAVEIKNEYPEPHKIIEVSQEWVDKSREHVLKHNLIPIPWKERVIVTPRVEYLRKTSYYGNFSFARTKDADSTYTSEMQINPFEDQWDEKKKKEFLVEHDWGVIIVTAPHETYAGHHVHGLYLANNPRPLRRENSISLFAEGWGLYQEQLMRETDFYPNDKVRLRQLQLRLWRNARVIYDVGLHTGKMSYEDAIALMTEKVGFLQWASQLEVDACCAAPGYYIGYFTGMMEILKMREDYKKKMGDKFTLSDFHEKLLKCGSMPTSLMRESLFLK